MVKFFSKIRIYEWVITWYHIDTHDMYICKQAIYKTNKTIYTYVYQQNQLDTHALITTSKKKQNKLLIINKI